MSTNQKSALITGSGQNIGRSVALHLGKSGYNVIVNGSSNREACESVVGEIKAAGGEAMVAMGNIGVREEAQSVAQAGLDAYGVVDVLVNNAAVRPDCSFLEVDEGEWNRVMDVNLGSVFWLSRACLPGMIKRGWGRIVNFTGMNAQQGYAGKSHVSTSKHAVWGLTKSLAKEFGPHGVTTNIISPGTIVSGGVHSHFSQDTLKQLLAANPVGRLGNPDDIASVIDLLVAKEGSFVNGQLLQINGGVAV